MTHNYLPLPRPLQFPIRNHTPIQVLHLRKLCQLAEAVEESEFVVEGCCGNGLKNGGRLGV